MDRINTTGYAILGILDLGARSGYDMKKWIDHGVGYFLRIGYGQLYPILNDFVKNELTTMNIEKTEGRPERKVYELTEKGREILYGWLDEPIEYDNNFNTNMLFLKLFFCDRVSPQCASKHLMDYKEYLYEKLKPLYELKKEFHEKGLENLVCRLSTVTNGITSREAQLKWCEDTLLQLEKRAMMKSSSEE